MLAYPCNTITLGRLSCHLKLKGILGLKWYLPMPKSRHAERLKRKQSEILCFQPTQRAVKKRKKKKKKRGSSSDFQITFSSSGRTTYYAGLGVCSTSSCTFVPFYYSIIPYLSGFSSQFSPSHMFPFRVPHTPTQNQGITLTDCYYADYSCCGLPRLFGLEAPCSRDRHYSVSCLAEMLLF